jgi:hypothetical protein
LKEKKNRVSYLQIVSLPERSVTWTKVSLKEAKMCATPKTSSPSRTWGPSCTCTSSFTSFFPFLGAILIFSKGREKKIKTKHEKNKRCLRVTAHQENHIKEKGTSKRKKWLFSYFVFVEKHVGNAVGDGKFSAGLRADEVSVDDLYLEEDVVGAL